MQSNYLQPRLRPRGVLQPDELCVGSLAAFSRGVVANDQAAIECTTNIVESSESFVVDQRELGLVVSGMTRMDIMKLVNRYIGVSGGYLGDFSYRTHAEFYTEYCNLDFNPYEMQGTTRERFIEIITKCSAKDQAKIVRGILAKYPPEPEKLSTRSKELHDEFLALVARLEAASPIASPTPAITSEVVQRAIADAETLILNQGATSGVDRLHTALHGYLKAVCGQAGIVFASDATLNALFRLIREQHPKFAALGHRAQDITTVMRAMAAIMDAMNPVRNNASMAHPNVNLLETPEAMLVINAARTILHYLDAKLG